jgi:hypothetical protein
MSNSPTSYIARPCKFYLVDAWWLMMSYAISYSGELVWGIPAKLLPSLLALSATDKVCVWDSVVVAVLLPF